MKIKIGDKIYDSNYEPIMVILENWDKENIKNMLPECKKYCVCPDSTSEEDIQAFMKTTKEYTLLHELNANKKILKINGKTFYEGDSLIVRGPDPDPHSPSGSYIPCRCTLIWNGNKFQLDFGDVICDLDGYDL